jgi:oligopeptide transport system substrate-binding protein
VAAAPAPLPVGAQPAPQEVKVGFLTHGEPESLDPGRASDAAVVRQVFEPLLRFDERLVPQPAAASYDVSPEGTVYTFHLRQDGHWSDGQVVTAKQFEYSWKRLLDPGLKAEYAPLFVDAGIVGADDYNSGRTRRPDRVGIRAIDDYTLEIRLVQPFGAFPAVAALWAGAPLRRDLVDENPDDWAGDPSTYIGNGAFMVSEWDHGDHLTLVPNPQYTPHFGWPSPTLTRVTLVMSTNGHEQDLAAFRNNERDWTLVPDSAINEVLNDPQLAQQAHQLSELVTFWVQVNTDREPLNNVLVRRALAKGVDRSALVRDVATGIGLPTTSVIPPGMPGFQDGLGHELGFDARGGRALLAQAGFVDGLEPELTFAFPEGSDNLRRAQYLQSQWSSNLGIDVELKPMDATAYQQALDEGDYDLAFGGWAADYPDPQDWFGAQFGCKGAHNQYHYCNSTFDQLVARADTASALEDRVLLYNQAQTVLTQDAPVLPLFVRGRLVLVKPWVRSTDGGALRITAQDDYPGSFFLDKVQILPH